MNTKDIVVPNLGEFSNVEIVEVLVEVGQKVAIDESLVVLETDKATMDVPSSYVGVVASLKVGVGDKISEGDVIGALQVDVATKNTGANVVTSTVKNADIKVEAKPLKIDAEQPAPLPKQIVDTKRIVAKAVLPSDTDMAAQLVVLGSGPGGYTAAFRAADLGLSVILVERYEQIGGVCLNVGCIPSKALLHIAQVINETQTMASHGVSFQQPSINIDKIRAFKDGVIKKLTGGLSALSKKRKITIERGLGKFVADNIISVTDECGNTKTIGFENAIIAVGSQPVQLPFIDYADARVLDSTDALDLKDIPKNLLVIGGGIIGLEMAQVYDALGSSISIVEVADTIMLGTDKDISNPLYKAIKKRYKKILLNTKVLSVTAKQEGLEVEFSSKDQTVTEVFDKVLVAVGRVANGKKIAADVAGITVEDDGLIKVNEYLQTNVKHIYAIGDVVGQPMLAHKAVHEGKIAAEVIAGECAEFSAMVIPTVAYTDPEVAVVGLTEVEAKNLGQEVTIGSFPWAASGRSLSMGRSEGVTKTIYDKKTGRLVGAAMVGPNAGELVAEAVLAIEMGADGEDISSTIHPHPTLSETFAMSAEMATGTITDLIAPKKTT